MSKTLSIEQAARVIFLRQQLRSGDIAQVRFWLEHGDLRGRRIGPQQWHVAEDEIAGFMAREADPTTLRDPIEENAAKSVLATQDAASQSELVRSYREAAQDYFLDVVMRRKDRYATTTWKRAVLVGQIAFVVTGISLFVWSVSQFDVSIGGTSPEGTLVEQWLELKYNGEFQIETIAAPAAHPNGDGIVLAVKYRYPSKHRGWIQTEQFFVVLDDQIVDVTSEL
jgi:hypothetical protein